MNCVQVQLQLLTAGEAGGGARQAGAIPSGRE